MLWAISPLEGSFNSCSMQQSLIASENAISQADLEPHGGWLNLSVTVVAERKGEEGFRLQFHKASVGLTGPCQGKRKDAAFPLRFCWVRRFCWHTLLSEPGTDVGEGRG